jgi:FlaA1/EpsC-like NDP-sugar epimerase
MLKIRIRQFLTKALLSRFLILSIDLMAVVFSLFSANALRFNFQVPPHVIDAAPYTLIYVSLIRLIPFYLLKTYAGLIKYTGERDVKNVLLSTVASSSFFILIYGLLRLLELGDSLYFFYPLSIILIDFLLLSFVLVGYRVSIKIISEEIRAARHGKNKNKKNVAIFGAGQSGLFVKRAIDDQKSGNMHVVAWLDDNSMVVGKSLEGIKIFHAEHDFDRVISSFNIDTIVLSIQNIDAHRRQRFAQRCLDADIPMMYTPPVKNWLNGEFNVQQLKKFAIEDVLDREPIVLDNRHLEFQLSDKVILVTGAAGSIGSEIVRQVASFKPDLLVVVDSAESPLVELGLEMQDYQKDLKIRSYVADVSNKSRMERIFKENKPDIVYHAAAYKHVPAMEHSPYEAVRVNVMGTRIVADLAVQYQSERFVMISTDKAVNPTNVMGCSKRIAEIYTQSLNNFVKTGGAATRFITTRFGNVLGSNGSVIPRFRKQIEQGGPVTVTSPDITRFFMTIPEACQLVLDAGAMGKGGEIFIFDMGKPVRIVDLAEKMIRLSGKIPGKDIPIVFTGLRPGEKLEEELLAKKENIIPTHHHKIMKARVREYDYLEAKAQIDQLISLLSHKEDYEIVQRMKRIVPEYKSKNSVFESLDKTDPAEKQEIDPG